MKKKKSTLCNFDRKSQKIRNRRRRRKRPLIFWNKVLIQPSDGICLFFNEKKQKISDPMWNCIDYLKIHWNQRRASKASWDKALNWANERMGMACKGEVWGIKSERGTGRT